MRSFGIRYGYYNAADWKTCRYIDPIVDTFADILGAQSLAAFAPDDECRKACLEKYAVVVKKFYKLIEANMFYHGGKYAGGNQLSIADFVVAGHMMGCTLNMKSPLPFYSISKKIIEGCPAEGDQKAEEGCPEYKALQDRILEELPYMKEDRPEYPF